eukprot:Transcript_19657.p1 GENE.Transcript_19657~~Transcript_19657.p1  ORF type:complete len:378 (-),score=28.14 Transcript_19657:469-1554(-)
MSGPAPAKRPRGAWESDTGPDEAQHRFIDSEELQLHASSDSCWVAIDGFVYDVTNFHHPGGNDRLFDRGGKDVSKAFAAIRHSDAAHRHLRRLLIGQLNSSAPPAEAAPLHPPSSQLTATSDAVAEPPRGPIRLLKEGANHRLPRNGEPLWSTRCRGFLPAYDPVVVPGPPYEVLTELVAALPTSLASGGFRALVDAASPRFAALEAALSAETQAPDCKMPCVPPCRPYIRHAPAGQRPTPHADLAALGAAAARRAGARPLTLWLRGQGLCARQRGGGWRAARPCFLRAAVALRVGAVAPPPDHRLRRLRAVQLGAYRRRRPDDARECAPAQPFHRPARRGAAAGAWWPSWPRWIVPRGSF